MKALTFILAALLDIVPAGQAFLKPLQQRDSVLIADQFKYGFKLENAQEVQGLQLPDLSQSVVAHLG